MTTFWNFGHQYCDARIFVTGFLFEFSFTVVSFLIEMLVDELKLVVAEKFQIEKKIIKIDAIFQIFRTLGIVTKG